MQRYAHIGHSLKLYWGYYGLNLNQENVTEIIKCHYQTLRFKMWMQVAYSTLEILYSTIHVIDKNVTRLTRWHSTISTYYNCINIRPTPGAITVNVPYLRLLSGVFSIPEFRWKVPKCRKIFCLELRCFISSFTVDAVSDLHHFFRIEQCVKIFAIYTRPTKNSKKTIHRFTIFILLLIIIQKDCNKAVHQIRCPETMFLPS